MNTTSVEVEAYVVMQSVVHDLVRHWYAPGEVSQLLAHFFFPLGQCMRVAVSETEKMSGKLEAT